MIGIEIHLRDNLNLLMQHFNISDALLAKKTDIPPQTIHRLKSGATPDPRISTLKVLAKFFCVSIDQLIGEVPIHLEGLQANTAQKLIKVPLLGWNQAYAWETIAPTLNEQTHSQWIYTDQVSSRNSFAIRVESNEYNSPFMKDSILFIDCALPLISSCHGVFSDHTTKKISIKQVIDDMAGIYLIHPSPTPFSVKFDNEKNSFLGIVSGVKLNF